MPPKYQCNICKQILSRSTTLRAHLRTHTGERPFTCPHCTKAFARQWDLEAHTKTHNGERKFVCNGQGPDIHSQGATSAGCGATFLRKRDLMRHLTKMKGSRCAAAADAQRERQGHVSTSEHVRETEAAEVLSHFRDYKALPQLKNSLSQSHTVSDDISSVDSLLADPGRILDNSFRTMFSEDPLLQHLTMTLFSLARLAAYSNEMADQHRKQIYIRAIAPLDAAVERRIGDDTLPRENVILGTALLFVIQALTVVDPEFWHIAIAVQRNVPKLANDVDLKPSIKAIGAVVCAFNTGLVHSYAYTGTLCDRINLVKVGVDLYSMGHISTELFALLCGIVLLDSLQGKEVVARLAQRWIDAGSLPKSKVQRRLAEWLVEIINPPSTVEGPAIS